MNNTKKIRNAAIGFLITLILAPIIAVAAPFHVALFAYRETSKDNEK